MDISRMKKLFAGMSAVAISLTQVASVVAAYSDVPAGVWYEDAVDAFTDAGYLDGSQTRFRGGDNANRAEFTKLVVELNGGILSTPPAVPSFDDVKPGAWYYGYMEEAAKEGWVKGDNNCYGSKPCNARPGANINRAEAAALIVRAFGLDSTGDAPSFVDVPTGQWYTDAVQTAADHCVLQGDDSTGRARPGDFMNRAEMVVMLNRVDQGLTYGVDCSIDNGSEPMIKDVTATGPSTVEVEFNVEVDENSATDAAKYMVSGASDIEVSSASMIGTDAVELTLADSTEAGEDYTLTAEDIETADGDMFSDSMDFAGYTEVEQGDGILEVSLASSNPSGDTVPQGAFGVVFASVDLTASCDDDVVISELTVLHEGFGATSDLSGVYAAMDGARMTRKRTIDSQDQTADLRFTDPLVIDACDTVTLDIAGDLSTSATASAEHNLAIELPSDVQSNAKDVNGNFPVRGNTFKVAAVDVGTVTLTYRSVSPSETEVGETNQGLGKFELEANSTEDQTIYSIMLEQNGTASDGDITNLRIRRSDGTVLTNTVASPVSDYATFVFDPPFTILEGDSITLEVVGDIVGGAAETVKFQLEETSDLFAVGSLYGYGVNGQLYGSQVSTSGTADTVTIDAGQLTIEINGPTQQSYTTDADDVVLANLDTMTGDESVDVQDLFIMVRAQNVRNLAFTGSLINDVLSDVELRNKKTGKTISATEVSTSGSDTTNGYGYQVYRFDDFLLEGDQNWEVRADFGEATDANSRTIPMNGDKFTVAVCASDAACSNNFASTQVLDAEGQSTGDAVTDIRPDTIIVGNYQRIATPSLVVTVESIGSSDTAVRNTKNINLLRFTAEAGEAEDVLFTGIVFNESSGDIRNVQNASLWVDSDGDGVVDTAVQTGEAVDTTNDQISFNDLKGGGYVIPAEETVVFEVHADVASTLQSTTTLLLAATTSADIDAEEADSGSALASTSITLTETNASKTYTFVTGGDLFVTEDSESIRNRQLLGGTLGESVLRLNMRAANEDIEVTDIQLVTSGSFIGAKGVERLELYKAGETTAFASATPGCSSGALGTSTDEISFCVTVPAGKLIVKKGQNDVDVIVRPRMKTDENGAASSSGFLIWTGSGGIEARGVNSSADLRVNDNDASGEGEVFIGTNTAASNAQIQGNNNMVVLAKISSITNANPDADNTTVPTGPSPIGQFKFTAATNNNTKNGNNKATLSGVIFNLTATNIDLDGGAFKFYNKADSSTKKTCTINGTSGASGTLLIECKGLVADAVATELSSGESATFVLEGDIDNPKVTAANTSNLQVSIQNFASISNTTFTASTSNLNWRDEDTTGYSFYWVENADTVIRSTSYRS